MIMIVAIVSGVVVLAWGAFIGGVLVGQKMQIRWCERAGHDL